MKIKQIEFVKAYTALKNLQDLELRIPSNIALKLFQVKKLCEKQYEFQTEQQLNILKQCGATPKKDGSWFIEDADKRIECITKLKELDELDIDVDYTSKDIVLDGSYDLSINDIEALSPFINFT